MKQMKYPLILIVAVLLLILGALLPKLTGWIQDSGESEDVRYATIGELQLKLYSGDMTILEKIAVAAKTEDSYAVPVSMATMTASEAMEKVEDALVLYQEYGMLRTEVDLQSQLDNITPTLVYTTGDDARSFVCWGVHITGDDWSMYLVLDDETGTLISIDYTVSSKSGIYDWASMDALISSFYEIYTSGLGEEFITSHLWQRNPAFVWEEQTLYCPIQWEDDQLGEITLILRVTPYGFNTTIY